MEKIEFGAFCEIYGKTLRNKVLEYLLEMGNLDFAVSDILKEIGISKPKMYELIKEMEKRELIKKSRVVSSTQLYVLNSEKPKVKLLKKSFKECLKLVAEEHQEKPSTKRDISAAITS